MRREAWLVVALLFAAAAVIGLSGLFRGLDVDPTPPGQYPLHAPRFEWPAREKEMVYAPAKAMGDQTIVFSDSHDAKTRCGTENTCPSSMSF
jgi:hypothetical protein